MVLHLLVVVLVVVLVASVLVLRSYLLLLLNTLDFFLHNRFNIFNDAGLASAIHD
jgi:hypothetical protein